MENLQTRLDSVQDSQLDLIEKDSKNICDHIEFWQLVKQEYIIYHAARQKGIVRLGLHRVPNLQVSEVKAKDAIEMVLLLKSLASSQYGTEDWSRGETSREAYEAEPKYCFQKGGTTVNVRWDGNKDNVTEYVAWDSIYCQNDAGQWEKVPGMLDYHGLFYIQDLVKIYFHSFDEDATRYSASRYWEVYYKNKPVTSVHPPIHTRTSPSPPAQQPTSRKRPLQTPAETPSSSKKARTGGGGGGRGRGGGRVLRRGTATAAQTPTSTSTHPSRRQAPSPCTADTYGLRSRGPGIRGRGGVCGVAPGDVGTVRQTVPKGRSDRVEGLLAAARDPFVLVFAGAPNSLKCLRYRFKSQHQGYFTGITTNYRWAEGEGQGSGARFMVAFESLQQRKAFTQRASFPQSVRMFQGNLESY
uniref:Regulatory protein E2 n=1 Tax=Mops bat papillomavirus TaxID=3141892 RepID=A0AAU7E2H5_9PAPI